jgi:predicted RNase H-like nuclease (RuvC/YqgF family)
MESYIINSVGDCFSSIASGVIQTLTVDLWFPKRPKTTEEKLRDALVTIRRQFFMIRSLQDQLQSKVGALQEMRRENSNLKDQLSEKDKRIKFLSDAKKSHELQDSLRTKHRKNR